MTAILDAAIRAVREAEDRSPVSLDDCANMFAKAAIRAMFDAAERDPAVIEAMLVAHDDRVMGKVFTTEGIEAALRALKAHVLG